MSNLHRDAEVRISIKETMTMASPNKIPKVFISYSWDSNVHREWVRKFAKRLRTQDGIDVILDQWDAIPGDQLPRFMAEAVSKSDFVLIICTQMYKTKSERSVGGVPYEGDVITGEIFTRGNHRKFIPILREGSWADIAPASFAGKYYIDLSGAPYSDEAYTLLVWTLHGIGPTAPPIGPRPMVELVPPHDEPYGSQPPVPGAFHIARRWLLESINSRFNVPPSSSQVQQNL